MTPRRLFVAGATGATGKVFVPLARAKNVPVVPLVRPKSKAAAPANAVVVDFDDAPALAKAMTGCTTLVQLIGTMRKRFATGDTYEASDIGTTTKLVAAAKTAGIDHIVLLSSVGAGRPSGAYLKAKARAEAIVRESGIPFTVFRPSILMGGERSAPPGFEAVTRALGLAKWQPIRLEDLSAAMVHVALHRAPLDTALEGKSL
ncbi:MAG TPA: NAD(P)H-binding protein, partial [bacterium]|nr:NAD(P)H-binding protein [bacterium]